LIVFVLVVLPKTTTDRPWDEEFLSAIDRHVA